MSKKNIPLFSFFLVCLILGPVLFAGATDAADRRVGDSLNGSAAQVARPQLINYAGQPVYDRGWHALGIRVDPIAVLFTHGLGGDPDAYLVHLACRDGTSLRTYDCSNQGFGFDAAWYGLTASVIRVYAGSVRPDEVRVRIYRGAAAYDSHWQSLGIRPDPISVDFNHNLGGMPGIYVVNLECRDDTALGTYDCTDQGFNVNAHWYDLTSANVRVYANSGTRPDDVRVRIYTSAAAYDSDWQTLGVRPDPISVDFYHDLRGDPENYLVHLECRDDTALATYDCIDNGFNVNAHWYDLNHAIIRVQAGSVQPDEIRVRIWRAETVFLPFVTKE